MQNYISAANAKGGWYLFVGLCCLLLSGFFMLVNPPPSRAVVWTFFSVPIALAYVLYGFLLQRSATRLRRAFDNSDDAIKARIVAYMMRKKRDIYIACAIFLILFLVALVMRIWLWKNQTGLFINRDQRMSTLLLEVVAVHALINWMFQWTLLYRADISFRELTNKIAIFIIALLPTQAFSQQPPPNIWDGELLHSATPRVKTTRDYWLNGKVRLVAEKKDSLYFDTQGRITREREYGFGRINITTYGYDDQGHLARENRAEYNVLDDGSRAYKPDKTYEKYWNYNEKGYLWRRIYMTTGVEKEQFEHTTYTTMKDTVVIGCEVKDQLLGIHTEWEYQYDFKKGTRSQYKWNNHKIKEKNLVETVNFDSIGDIIKITKFNNRESQVIYLRQEIPGGNISSSYQYNEDGTLKFEERTRWKDRVKQWTRYYSPDSNKVMEIVRTSVFNDKGEAIADSLHYCGIVQQYSFITGNPDFLQINTDNKGNIVWRNETKYNTKGNLIYHKSERSGDVSEEKYDDNRNMIYSKDGASVNKAQFVYDKQGNWIKATHSGTLFKTYSVTRSVYYYP